MTEEIGSQHIQVKRKRVKKNEIHKEEQQNILKKFNEILGIDEQNNAIILEEFKTNIEKHKQILSLENEIKQYFAYGNWAYFKGNLIEENKSLCLVRSVYKACGYDINYKQKMKNGNKYTEYYFIKKHN